MPALTPRRRAVGAITVAALASGVVASVALPAAPRAATSPAATAAPARVAVTTSRQAGATSIDHLTTVARHRYATEVHGGVAQATLRRVGRDPTLLRTLQSGNLSATRAYVAQAFPSRWYHWHVSRMRILRGSQVVVETGVPFVVAPSQMTLRGANGRPVGTLQVSIQDEIGFVRFMHRNYPVDVVVRGQGAGHVRTSLPAAAQAKLPASGPVTLAGRRYQVRSFNATGWSGEPVTIWILGKG